MRGVPWNAQYSTWTDYNGSPKQRWNKPETSSETEGGARNSGDIVETKESKPRMNSGFWMVDSGIHSNSLLHPTLPWLYPYLLSCSFHTHYPTQAHGLSNHTPFLLFPLRFSLLSSSHCGDSTSRTPCFMSPVWIQSLKNWPAKKEMIKQFCF